MVQIKWLEGIMIVISPNLLLFPDSTFYCGEITIYDLLLLTKVLSTARFPRALLLTGSVLKLFKKVNVL